MQRLFLFQVFLTLLAAPAMAQGAAMESEHINLRSAVERALENNPLLKASHLDVERAKIGVRRADAEKYLSRSEVKFATGLVPEARGTVLDSPDKIDDYNSWGPFYRMNLRLAQPLYTFGKLASLQEASHRRLEVEEEKHELALQTAIFETIKTYWALSSSLRGESVAGDLRENFAELLSDVESLLMEEDSEVDDADVLEVKSAAYQIEKTYLDAVEKKKSASQALQALVGVEEDTTLTPMGEEVPQFVLEESEFEKALTLRKSSQREINILAAASRALEAKINLKKSGRYPIIYLAGGASYAHAGNRTDQTNPFVRDDFNYFNFGAEVGLTWNLNIYKKNLEISELREEYNSVLQLLAARKQKAALEAQKAFRETKKNRALMYAARSSLKSSRSWLRLSLDNWELGIGEVKKVLNAYEAYYRMKGIEIEREYQLNVSLARLAFELGDINLYLQWVSEGKIVF